MKTQEQLSKMTEQELTFELACLVFGDDNVYVANFGKVGVSAGMDAGYVSINDWSWLMPLVVENEIDITRKSNDRWGCACWIDLEYCYPTIEDTLQRAIAICLILKLQEI